MDSKRAQQPNTRLTNNLLAAWSDYSQCSSGNHAYSFCRFKLVATTLILGIHTMKVVFTQPQPT